MMSLTFLLLGLKLPLSLHLLPFTVDACDALLVARAIQQERAAMYAMTDDAFEELVEEALDSMPAQFMEDMENVAVVIADEPTDEELSRLDDAGHPAGTRYGGEILGLYDGVPLTERYFEDGEGGYPDVITIFKGPHERCFGSEARIAAEVRKTVIHEIGHHFGLSDARLHEMGY